MQKTGSALGALAMASLVLSGCAVKPVTFVKASPPPQDGTLCSEIIKQVRVPLPAPAPSPTAVAGPASPAEETGGGETDLGTTLKDLLGKSLPVAGALNPGQQPVSPSVLILSGGSQNGAFGAGFLDEWKEKRTSRSLPRFRLVTGISTGALQSTFAFLGKTGVPVEQYSIASEGDLLRPYVKGKLEDKPFSAGRQLATKGTLASLQPLRERLDKVISHEIMMEVAAEAAPGTDDERRLLVGAVEMSSGEMAVFDLTEAATLYADSFNASGKASTTDHPKAYMRQCYIEALMASSSVPMAAAPVFIDNKMYIDGGARFGVLVDLAAAAYQTALAEKPPAKEDKIPRNLFIVVNGTLEVPQLCRLKKCPVDENGTPQPLEDDVPHSEWDFLQVAQRSVSVLINQSYRSSVFIADGQYRPQGFTTHFAKIEPEHLTHSTAIDFPGAGSGEKTCAQWREEDERIDKPMEFYPRFMRCLISYGRAAPKLREFIAAE